MGMKSVFCVIFSLVAAVGVSARAEGIDVTSGNFESYRALKDGNTYRFVESVTFAAPSGESALKVADGATVTLNIPSGVTVTLTGGSANGVTGAGAGIEVPASATLNIIGQDGDIVIAGLVEEPTELPETITLNGEQVEGLKLVYEAGTLRVAVPQKASGTMIFLR